MTGRAFVLIFFFWALLTIITPTLIILSASANASLDSKGEESGGTRPRKMMGYVHEEQSRTELEAPAPAPTKASTSNGGFRIQMAYMKSENLNRVSDGLKRATGSSFGETRL